MVLASRVSSSLLSASTGRARSIAISARSITGGIGPAALRVLRENGLDANSVVGTGPKNNIMKSDALQAASQARAHAAAAAAKTIEIEFRAADVHLCDPQPNVATVSHADLLEWHETMYMFRRTEIAADQLYKAKEIRGFCHLYDGQEAVCMGMEAAITFNDSIITAYRDHCQAMCRGDTPHQVLAELTGRFAGSTKGKGGSMHFYNSKKNFWGGHGIVGAQTALGTGIAFAHQFKKDGGVCFAMFGDGAANQGQLYEALNMASLWKIPIIYVCENNRYGMGTTNARAAANTSYYTRGSWCPGMRVDGMDVIAVREACAFAAQYAREGKGPFFLEFDTYRYHGHSMSDPGTSYRNRDEIGEMRAQRDPVERVKKLILEHGVATEAELKATEKKVRATVQEAVDFALSAPQPPMSEMVTNVYSKEPTGHSVRGILGSERLQ